MGTGNAALQRNLAELESEIERLTEHPSSYIHDDIDGKVGFYQAARKIAFIKNLLTAEMDSQSGGRAEHLNDMAMRLSIQEKTFVNWARAARFSILDETLVNWVEAGDGDGAVNKSSNTSASCSCTESCVVDEEFVEEDNVNQEAKEFCASETETNFLQVSQDTERGRMESMEEGINDEEENERYQEEEKEGGKEVEVTTEEKRSDRKQAEMGGERTPEVTKVSESKVEVNEDEKLREQQQQEVEMVEERKVVVKEDAEGRGMDRKGVEKVTVEATEEKGRWEQDREKVGEIKYKTQENKGSERKEGAELVGKRTAKEIEEVMAAEKSTEAKNEKERERNQEKQTSGESTVEVIHDKQEEGKEEGEMMETTTRGRERKQEAEIVEMEKDDKKRRERKQQSCCSVRNRMAIGCAAAGGFAIALIGVAVANIYWVEEVVYLVPT